MQSRYLRPSGFFAQISCSFLGTTLVAVQGCILVCSHPNSDLIARGAVVDVDTLEPVPIVAVRAVATEQGEEIGSGSTELRFVEDNFVRDDGTFQVVVGGREIGRVCPGPFAPPPEYPPPLRPDTIEFVIVREDCEQRVTVPINADTVVDPSFPDETLVLKEPLEVPPCEEANP